MAWEHCPKGGELSPDVPWEREEMKERGTLSEYEERVASLVEKSSLAQRVQWYEIQLRAIAAFFDLDLTDECRQVTTLALVIHGGRDKEVPVDWGRALASAIPGAELRLYPEESHSIVHRSGTVRTEVIMFLQRGDNEGAAGTVRQT